jgi:hypothetical protein
MNEPYDNLHARLYPEVAAKQEYIICAAIYCQDNKVHREQPSNIKTGFVVCGRRHSDVFALLEALGVKFKDYSEEKLKDGFITSKNRFVDRFEAAQVANKAGQLRKPLDWLQSEELY